MKRLNVKPVMCMSDLLCLVASCCLVCLVLKQRVNFTNMDQQVMVHRFYCQEIVSSRFVPEKNPQRVPVGRLRCRQALPRERERGLQNGQGMQKSDPIVNG